MEFLYKLDSARCKSLEDIIQKESQKSNTKSNILTVLHDQCASHTSLPDIYYDAQKGIRSAEACPHCGGRGGGRSLNQITELIEITAGPRVIVIFHTG